MQRINRRDALLTSAAGILAGARSLARPGASAPPPGDLIDAHAHIWTPDVRRYPLAGGLTAADLQPASFTADELLAVSRQQGVGRVVLIQHHIYHGWDNSYLTDTAEQHSDVFRVVGMVNDVAPAPDQAMRQLQKRFVTSFRITSLIRGASRWLSGPGMEAMWTCAADTRQSLGCLINPADLPNVDRMCARFPETPVVVDHFARIGIDGELRESDLQQLCRLARHPHTYVKVSAFYALGKQQPPYTDLLPMIRRVYDAFGPQRLMWASDSPYQLDGVHSYSASLDLIRAHTDFLSHEDRDWMLRGTAEKVYFAGKA